MEGETRITDYRPVKPKKLPGSRSPRAAESQYWKSFSSKNIQKQIASVSCVHFCPEPPYHFAVTSSTRVTVYDGETCKVKKTISRFTDVAYSGVFRPDGQLLVAGGEMGIIQAFDMNSRLVLRQLKGHTRAVHWVRYSPTDKLHLLSGSDDNTVRWWDMATQTELLKLEAHTDYVRSGSAHPSSPDLWATGSYDHTANLWDLRTGNSTLQMQHGRPLEDVLFFPSGGLIATAGGNVVKIWDVLGGGKLLHTLKNHQKTVTCLCITPPMKASPSDAISAPRLLTGSLDGHIKVFDVSDFKVVHASKYPSPIMSMDISKSMWTMAVGTSSGDLFIRQKKKVVQADTVAAGSVSGVVQEHLKAERVLRPTNYRYFLRGRTEKATEEDYVVKQRQRLPHLHEHDKFFRKFQHKEALLSALKTKNPTVVIAVIEELIFRHGLISSISNLDAASLELLLAFLNKYTTVPRFSRILIPLAHKVLDKCSTDFTQSKSILHQVSELRKAVREEVSLQESLQSLQGLLQPILRASLQ